MKYVKYVGYIEPYPVSEGFGEPLTVGKTYIVLDDIKGYYKIINNYNKVWHYPVKNFVEITREEKLKRILND